MKFDYELTFDENQERVAVLTVKVDGKKERPAGFCFDLLIVMADINGNELHRNSAQSDTLPFSVSFKHLMNVEGEKPEEVSVSSQFSVLPLDEAGVNSEAPIVDNSKLMFFGQKHCFEKPNASISVEYRYSEGSYTADFTGAVELYLKQKYKLLMKDIRWVKFVYSADGDAAGVELEQVSKLKGKVLRFATKTKCLPLKGSAQKAYFKLKAVCLVSYADEKYNIKLPVMLSVDSRDIK